MLFYPIQSLKSDTFSRLTITSSSCYVGKITFSLEFEYNTISFIDIGMMDF